jgi:hypothetical protein
MDVYTRELLDLRVYGEWDVDSVWTIRTFNDILERTRPKPAAAHGPLQSYSLARAAQVVNPACELRISWPSHGSMTGVERIASSLGEWLPDPAIRKTWSTGTAGSHLLKNFVWLLAIASSDDSLASGCDRLVERLTRTEITPADRGKRIALACARYFSQRPPSVGREPLSRLLAWSSAVEKSPRDTDGIRRIVESYEAQHRA